MWTFALTGACVHHRCSCSLHHLLQVINRDLSIAVLRYFVRQRQEEISEGILKAPRPKRTPAEAAQLKQSAGDMQSYLLLHLPRKWCISGARSIVSFRAQAQMPWTELGVQSGHAQKDFQWASVVFAEGPMPRPKLDENIRILEGLAASGLRSIRYALEVEPSF